MASQSPYTSMKQHCCPNWPLSGVAWAAVAVWELSTGSVWSELQRFFSSSYYKWMGAESACPNICVMDNSEVTTTRCTHNNNTSSSICRWIMWSAASKLSRLPTPFTGRLNHSSHISLSLSYFHAKSICGLYLFVHMFLGQHFLLLQLDFQHLPFFLQIYL